jgi:hypothetical protein
MWAAPSAAVWIAPYGPRPPISELGVMSPQAPGRMAHGSCLLDGPDRRSIVTLKLEASTGVSVIVPDMRLDVVPVGATLAIHAWPGGPALAAEPAGVGDALELVEADEQPASVKTMTASAANEHGRM